MIYSSLEFLAAFPPFAILYRLAAGRTARRVLLLVSSLLFYAYGEPGGLAALGYVALTAYAAGLAIERFRVRSRALVGISAALLLAPLAWLKYAGFVGQIAQVTITTGWTLPLGISFFTFEAIAYVVDVYRGTARAARSPLDIALYMTFFPHLIAGPIMRPNDLLPQMRRLGPPTLDGLASGGHLFLIGLVKKVLIADPAGYVADLGFGNAADMGATDAWLAALAYTVQIYGDFSGYTDMGRGVARVLGVELPRNFDSPYVALSITEFWRRWHISLSSWLRDYLYIPLGGNRRGGVRTYVNVMATMLLGGLWHGAAWTFVIWGGYHGALLALERATGWPARIPAAARWLVMFVLVVHGWVLFRAGDLATYWSVTSAMLFAHGLRGRVIEPSGRAVVLAALAVVLGAMWAARARPGIGALPRRAIAAAAYGAIAGVAVIEVATRAAPAPFIYFRF